MLKETQAKKSSIFFEWIKGNLLIFVLSIWFFLIVLSIILVVYSTSYHPYNTADPTTVLKEIERSLRGWDILASLYQIGVGILGAIAIVSSIFVAAVVGQEKMKKKVQVASILAAFIFTFLSSFNLSQKSNDIRNAYRHLNAAVMIYKANRDSSLNSINKLITSYSESEKMIGSINFNYRSTDDNK